MNIAKPTTINKKFIYKYMGYGDSMPDSAIQALVEACSNQLLAAAQPREIHGYFDIGILSSDSPYADSIYVGRENFALVGRDIADHLSGCHGCILLAITLGSQVDRIIRTAQVNDMSKALILDFCASVLIEELCDQISESLESEYSSERLYLTMRFSPGYGDLPLHSQDIFINLLDTNRKIGLTQSKEHLLLPRKSVTAIIGVSNKKTKGKLAGCDACALKENCKLRESGVRCGKEK